MLNLSGWPRKLGSPFNRDSQKGSKMRRIVKFRLRGTPLWQIWTWNSLILWVTDIRLKENSEASRCGNMIFYGKKHRCFKSLTTLTHLCIEKKHCERCLLSKFK